MMFDHRALSSNLQETELFPTLKQFAWSMPAPPLVTESKAFICLCSFSDQMSYTVQGISFYLLL